MLGRIIEAVFLLQIVNFVLSDLGIPSAPRDFKLKIESSVPPAVEATWTPPEETNGEITSYVLRILNENNGRYYEHRVTNPYYKKTNLEPGCSYEFRVFAENEVGLSRAASAIIRTPEVDLGPPSAPSDFSLAIEQENPPVVRASWSPPEETNGENILGYRLSVNNENVGFAQEFRLSKTANHYVTRALDYGTTYEFRLVALNEVGLSEAASATIKTPTTALPSVPQDLELSLEQENPPVVKVSWSPRKETNGKVDMYKLSYKKSNEDVTEEERWILRTTFVTGFLDYGVTYEFRVAAQNEAGVSEAVSATIKTPDGVPRGPPRNITASQVYPNQVTLRWQPPKGSLTNGAITSYNIQFYPENDVHTKTNKLSGSTAADIFDLEPGVVYKFKIQAATSQGLGPFSEPIRFATVFPTPDGLQAQKISAGVAEVSWEPSEYQVAGYRVYYNLFAVSNMDLWQSMDLGPVTSVRISGLEPNALYAVRVQAKALDGTYGRFSKIAITQPLNED